MPRHETVEALPEAAVLPDEAAAFGGKTRTALGPAAGVTLEELHAGGALEIAEVSPRRPVGHAHLFHCLLEGTEPLYLLEKLSAPFAELDPLVEDDPELETRTALDGAAHGVSE